MTTFAFPQSLTLVVDGIRTAWTGSQIAALVVGLLLLMVIALFIFVLLVWKRNGKDFGAALSGMLTAVFNSSTYTSIEFLNEFKKHSSSNHTTYLKWWNLQGEPCHRAQTSSWWKAQAVMGVLMVTLGSARHNVHQAQSYSEISLSKRSIQITWLSQTCPNPGILTNFVFAAIFHLTRKNWRLRRHFCSLRLPSDKSCCIK